MPCFDICALIMPVSEIRADLQENAVFQGSPSISITVLEDEQSVEFRDSYIQWAVASFNSSATPLGRLLTPVAY